MAMACHQGVGVAETLPGETNDGDQEGSLKFHWNLMALFAAKASSDQDIEDFWMWRVRSVRGGEGASSEQVILAYKRRGDMEDNGGWSFLLPPSRIEGRFIESTDILQNASQLSKDVLMFFEIYTRLKNDPNLPVSFGDVKNVLFYMINTPHLILPGCFLEESKEKEFIFTSAVWELRDDFEIREGLVRKMKIEIPPCTDDDKNVETFMPESVNFSGSEFQDFLAKVSFSYISKTYEIMEESTKREIGGCVGDSEAGIIHERLLTTIRDKLEGESGGHSIQGSELKGLFEKLGSDRVEIRRFNLSDPVPAFVERSRELRQILYLLGGTSEKWEIGPVKKLVLSGLGGAGKSELAREYCRRHFASLYDNIAWINAESKETLTASFKSLAFKSLGIDKKTAIGGMKDVVEIIMETFAILARHRTLLVYDNAESFHQTSKYLPSESVKGQTHIILTSRSRDWKDFPLIPLEYFNEEEALQLVKGSLCNLKTWSDEEGLALCKGLGFFPLALMQAVSYIREKDNLLRKEGRLDSILEYLQLLESNPELMLDHAMYEVNKDDYKETTYRVIRSTLQHLKKTMKGEIATIILNVLSYLCSDNIDIDVMVDANPKYSRDVVQMGFAQLSKLSIINIQSGKVRIHCLIQAVNRSRLRSVGMEVHVLRDAMRFSLPMDVQHMLSVWEHVRRHESLIKDCLHFPFEILGKLLDAELYDAILSYLRNAHDLLISILGPHHPEIVYLMLVWCKAQYICGELEKDEDEVKKYYSAWHNVQCPKSPYYFNFLYTYGSNLIILHKFKEALSVFNEILLDGSYVLGANSDIIQMAKFLQPRLQKFLKNETGLVSDLKQNVEWMSSRSSNGNSTNECTTVPHVMNDVITFPGTLEGTGNTVNLNLMDNEINFGGESIAGGLLPPTNYALELLEKEKFQEAFVEFQKLKELAQNDFGDCDIRTVTIRFQLAKLHLVMGRTDCAQKEFDCISSQMKTFSKINVMSKDFETLRVQIWCAGDKYKEAIQVILSWCLNESKSSINRDGLHRVFESISICLDSGKFKVVSRLVREVLSTLETCSGLETIPIVFLRLVYKVSMKLSEQGLKKQALGILKVVYREFKTVMGEANVETLLVKFSFACIYCSVDDGQAMGNGLKCLLEIRATLLKMDVERVPELRELMDKVKAVLKQHGAK